MRKIYVLAAVFILLCFSYVFAASHNAPAKKVPHKNKEHTSSPATSKKEVPDTGFDVMLLIDSSGSMKKTDPMDLRKSAAKLIISLMGHDDRIGVISFGDTAKTLVPLTKNTSGNRATLFKATGKITSKEYSTHIHDAVSAGFDELKSSQRKNRILILMSDGKLTTGSEVKDREAFTYLNKILPELAKAHIKLYSIAFTDFSDLQLLEDMAKAAGGFFKFAKTDKDVHVMFTSIFEKIKSPDTVPIVGDEFSIDKDINEATLVITKKAGTRTTIVDPAGKGLAPAKHEKNIQWYESQVFDMITIKEPAPGKWKVKLSSTEGNRVFVLTKLNLKSAFNKDFVTRGDKFIIDAWLEKEDSILKETEVLGQVLFYADITGPDGKHIKLALSDNGSSGDAKPGDGMYAAEFQANSTGEYSIKLAAESRTFKREKNYQIKASEPHVTKDNSSKEAKKHAAAGKHSSWPSILTRFGLVNLVVLVTALIIYRLRKQAPGKTKEKIINKKTDNGEG